MDSETVFQDGIARMKWNATLLASFREKGHIL
jgi:hypothetical protein